MRAREAAKDKEASLVEATKGSTKVDVFSGLSEKELEQVLSECRSFSLAEGEFAFTEGELGSELCIVKSGKIRITKAISLDVARTLAVIGKGGIFGELAIIDVGLRSAGAQAVEASEILALSREAFERILAGNQELAGKILARLATTLAERLRMTNDLLRDTVAWGLEVSGAAAIGLTGLIQWKADLHVTLTTGKEVHGRLLKVDKSAAGVELTIKDRDERLHLVPYHAVVSVSFPGEGRSPVEV